MLSLLSIVLWLICCVMWYFVGKRKEEVRWVKNLLDLLKKEEQKVNDIQTSLTAKPEKTTKEEIENGLKFIETSEIKTSALIELYKLATKK